MDEIRWRGRTVTAEHLFEAAREARARSWLDEPSRLFLHRIGLTLAGGSMPSRGEQSLLEGMLDALRRRGSFALAALEAGLAAAPPAGGGAAAPSRRERAARPRLPGGAGVREDGGAVAAVEAEIASLGVLLASAAERLEACRLELAGLRRGGR